MLLQTLHQKLGWPSRDEVIAPTGAGPAVYARLVQSKLGRALSRSSGSPEVEVGILAGDPKADSTEPPLAVVCEFKRVASDAAIEEAHRLAWNFCRAPLLITLEPHLVRTWTTCERPRSKPDGTLPGAEISSLRIDPRDPIDFEQAAARSLSWISLASGQLFRDYAPRFPRQQCADETLLANLKSVRSELVAQKLSIETVHDLLARLMFVQFLFHRKDDKGHSALTPEWLKKQYETKKLSSVHKDLESLLRNHSDAYAFFRLLNERFNGDLFPGKASDPRKREAEWRDEMKEVHPAHLKLLADFVGGKVLPSGQHSLWPLYSFDLIPLEFISSIYETFVSKDKGTHYTPAYLVDVVLDTCLPWNGDDWDVKVLDPACGSGIFLVKAFQRLVYRWRRSHRFKKNPDTNVLRKLLTENLFGVDVQREAVRVASFSLYLAMCDELEPRYIWDRVKFPLLRGSRLIAADFFKEDVPGFRTLHERASYDVVVGNAPWGTGTVQKSPLGKKWAKSYRWDISYEDIGPLFLAKGAKLATPNGRVSMLQSSGLLFKTSGKAASFRRQLLKKHKVERVVNLAALRFGLFKEAVGPACIFTLTPSAPEGAPITYVSPKPSRTADDEFRIVFDAYDYHAVSLEEIEHDQAIWTALMWGGRRDYALVRRLSRLPTLAAMEAKRQVNTRQGIVRGKSLKERNDDILGLPILEAKDFPAKDFPFLDAAALPKNTNARSHRPIDPEAPAFQPPQLLIKSGWRRETGRFQARLLRSNNGPTLCSELYLSAHFPADRRREMDAACLVYNSKFAAYYLLHTSSRFAAYNQEVNVNELKSVPLPEGEVTLAGVKSQDDVDDRLRQAFGLKPAESVLVEDAFAYTMDAFRATKRLRKKSAQPVSPESAQSPGADAAMLEQYGDWFARVLRAGFGFEKRIRMTVYRTPVQEHSPVHLVALHLDWPGDDDGVHFVDVKTGTLLQQILDLAHSVEQRSGDGATMRRRVFQTYDTIVHGHAKVPTVFICKPNLPRYWTRSIAMRDADVVSVDLVRLASASRPRGRAASA